VPRKVLIALPLLQLSPYVPCAVVCLKLTRTVRTQSVWLPHVLHLLPLLRRQVHKSTHRSLSHTHTHKSHTHTNRTRTHTRHTWFVVDCCTRAEHEATLGVPGKRKQSGLQACRLPCAQPAFQRPSLRTSFHSLIHSTLPAVMCCP
jgi:hypothetical protein